MRFFTKGPSGSSSDKKSISGKKPVPAFKIGARLSRKGDGDISSPFVEDTLSETSGAVHEGATGHGADGVNLERETPVQSVPYEAPPELPAQDTQNQDQTQIEATEDHAREPRDQGDPFSALYDFDKDNGGYVDESIFDSIPRSSDVPVPERQSVQRSPQRRRKAGRKPKNPAKKAKGSIIVNVSKNLRKRRQAKVSVKKAMTEKKKPAPKTLLYAIFGVVLLAAVIVTLVTGILERPEPAPPEEQPIERNETNTVISLPSVENNYKYRPYSFESSSVVDYTGPVEVVTINPVIAFPQEAFDGSTDARDRDSASLTATEYQAVLQRMYEKGYLVVSINDLWSEQRAEDGSIRMVRNVLKIPEGRKPVILIYENMDYTEDMGQHGYIDELVVGKDGEIWGKYVDSNGVTRLSQSLDAITILDIFIEQNPDFSYNGAKGCISIKGNMGILGFKTQSDPTASDMTGRNNEIRALAPVLSQLKNTGWYFACGTYDGIDVNATEYTALVADMTKWVDEAGSLVGETDIIVCPGVSSITDNTENFKYLYSLGFRVFAVIGDVSSESSAGSGSAIICTAMELTGENLRQNGGMFSEMFDASQIYDGSVRPSYGTSFTVPSTTSQDDGGQTDSSQDDDGAGADGDNE